MTQLIIIYALHYLFGNLFFVRVHRSGAHQPGGLPGCGGDEQQAVLKGSQGLLSTSVGLQHLHHLRQAHVSCATSWESGMGVKLDTTGKEKLKVNVAPVGNTY